MVLSGLVPTPGARNLRAPFILAHPQNQTVVQGTSAMFSVTANGSVTVTYQWRFGNDDIGGATSNTLTVSGVTSANEGLYRCVVTNPVDSVTSNPATLTVTQTFAQWATANGIPGAVANGDADGDGLANAIEFFGNSSPTTVPTSAERAAMFTADREPATGPIQYITLTYRRNVHASVASLTYEVSADLATAPWTPTAPTFLETLTPDPTTGDPRFRAKFQVTGDAQKFVRMRVTP
jgi:hypothetical protein